MFNTLVLTIVAPADILNRLCGVCLITHASRIHQQQSDNVYTFLPRMRETRTGRVYLIGSQWIMLTLWQWLTQELFPHTKTSAKRLLIIGGAIAGLILLAFPYITSHIALRANTDPSYYLYTSLTLPFSGIRIRLLCLYLLIPVIFLMLLFRRHRASSSKYILLGGTYLISCLLIVLGWGFNQYTPSLLLMGYLFIAASSEELLKFLSTYRLFQITPGSGSFVNDLLPYSLLSAYGFAWFENIIYLVSQLSSATDGSRLGISGSFLSLSLGRGIFGFLLHGIFSGCIAYIIQKYSSLNIIKSICIAFFVGVFLHFSYNALLSYGLGRGILLYIILSYAGTSYFLYNSNRLYIPHLSVQK